MGCSGFQSAHSPVQVSSLCIHFTNLPVAPSPKLAPGPDQIGSLLGFVVL